MLLPSLSWGRELGGCHPPCSNPGALRSMLSQYSSSLPKFWSLENCRCVRWHTESCTYVSPRPQPALYGCGHDVCFPVWWNYLLNVSSLITSLLLLLHSFVCFSLFLLCCVGVGVFEAWCAFGCITFWMHFFPFLRFVVFFKCWVVLLADPRVWVVAESAVFSKCCSVVPIPLVWSRLVALLSSRFRVMWLVLKVMKE